MKKRIVSFVAAAVLLLATACSGSPAPGADTGEGTATPGEGTQTSGDGTKVNPPGVFPITDEPITLRAYAIQTASVEDLKTNLATLELQEATGIQLELEVVMKDVAQEKRNLMLASGDYPDIFLSGRFTASDIATYGIDQQILIPLDELIEEYAPTVKETDNIIDGFLDTITAGDGHIYSLPAVNIAYHVSYPAKMWVNTTWLDTLGLDIPETTEDFREMLRAFKSGDPNGNGQQDELPLVGYKKDDGHKASHLFQYFMNSFIQFDGVSYFINDGGLQFIANTEEWRQGLGYIHSLYEEGLIDPVSFTQDIDQLRQLANMDETIVGAVPTLHCRSFVNMDTDDGQRHKSYNAIPPVEGPDGVREAALGTIKLNAGEYGFFAITDKCQYPEAAMRLADYIYTEEGTILMEEGPKGVNWEDAAEGRLNIEGNQAKYTVLDAWGGSGTVQNMHWHQEAPTRRTAEYRNSFSSEQDIYSPDGYERRLYLATYENYEPYRSNRVIPKEAAFNKEQNEVIAQLGVNIESYIQQSIVQFATGDKSLDTDWDSYLKGLEDLGLEQYISVYSQGYGIALK